MDSAGKPGMPVPIEPAGIPPDVAVTVVVAVAVLVTELRLVTVERIEVVTVAADNVTVETIVEPGFPADGANLRIVDNGCDVAMQQEPVSTSAS
jgi:hypothetical protein